MEPNFGFSFTPRGKVESDILSKSQKNLPKRSVAILVDLFLFGVSLMTSLCRLVL